MISQVNTCRYGSAAGWPFTSYRDSFVPWKAHKALGRGCHLLNFWQYMVARKKIYNSCQEVTCYLLSILKYCQKDLIFNWLKFCTKLFIVCKHSNACNFVTWNNYRAGPWPRSLTRTQCIILFLCCYEFSQIMGDDLKYLMIFSMKF